MEIAKRLKPLPDTVRYLFAHSGNVCAFPGCDHPLIDRNGLFVAQVCHIEAAEPGGERFNARMTNEERRHRKNLLLMCHRHHVETNDVARFDVEHVRRIKEDHEGQYAAGKLPVPETQFEEAVQAIVASSIVDQTKRTRLVPPQTLARWNRETSDDGRGLTPEELRGSLDEMLLPMLESLGKLPVDTRGVLLVVVERGEPYGGDIGLPFHELEHATGADADLLSRHVETLRRYSIARMDDEWRENDVLMWVATWDLDGWPFWRSLKDYSRDTGLALEDFIMELRFDLLD